jgi:hypothetical protein
MLLKGLPPHEHLCKGRQKDGARDPAPGVCGGGIRLGICPGGYAAAAGHNDVSGLAQGGEAFQKDLLPPPERSSLGAFKANHEPPSVERLGASAPVVTGGPGRAADDTAYPGIGAVAAPAPDTGQALSL